jgi:CxxC motif-containing protein (DUF1111 family)
MRLLIRSFPVWASFLMALPIAHSASPEAPTGFDNLTNGFTPQAQFDADREIFEELEFTDDGLGPVYNAQGCVECHQSPVTGGVSQVTEIRAGHFDRRRGFIDHPGGSLIHDRAVDAGYQEQLMVGHEVLALRSSLNVLGDGFIEAIPDETIRAIAQSQPGFMRGRVIEVPLLESPGTKAVGRFGWKNQHASLVSFSADAYLNEMGITTPFPGHDKDNTSNGKVYDDGVADPEDDGEDVRIFARFMRATKAPPRDAQRAASADAQAGSRLFDAIGCAVCHVRDITTAPVDTVLHGGAFTVTAALGDKVIHPFSDFLLHDVGTGDGIVQNGGAATRNRLRTPPLWGLRTRSRFMHDGLSLSLNEAILRHRSQAAFVSSKYRRLGPVGQRQILAFLRSL